jgi:hypothetical protein
MSAERPLHFATHHPADGRALRYHFDEFMLSWIRGLASRLAGRPAWGLASSYLGRDALTLYIEQALGLELQTLGRSMFQAQFARVRDAAADVSAPRALAGLLRADTAQLGVRVVPSPLLDLQRGYFRLRRAVRQAVVRRRAHPAQRSPRGSTIAVELVEGADPSKKCDAFWLASGTIDPARVLFVLEGPNRTLVNVEENADAIRRMGARVVAVDPVMARGNVPYWSPDALPRWVKELETRLRGQGRGADRWLAATIRSFARRVGYWESFFRDHGVQVIQDFTEFSLETMAKRVAIDRLGGIELGKLRSQFFEKASAAFCFRHEIAFLWHRNAIPFLRSGHTSTDYAIETGYVYDYLAHDLKAEGDELRQRLVSNGAKTIVCVFDNQTHPFSHFSAEHLAKFYETALSLAEARPSVGLIVKSKKPGIIPKRSGISLRVRALVEAGRCIVIDQPLVSVLPAALASELALAIPASTAACEAALAGCRVFMYDPSRSREHPWAQGAGIMFDDLDAFRSACGHELDLVASGKRSMPRARLLELDPFLDGRASHRAAGFINAFLAARERGLDKAASLSAALESCADYALAVDAGS